MSAELDGFEGDDPEWACTHCGGEGDCMDGSDPSRRLP